MPSFRDKLNRLHRRPPTGEPAAPAVREQATGATAERDGALTALGVRLAARLGGGAAPRVPPEPARLPFRVEPTPQGDLHVRRLLWSPAASVGEISLAASLGAMATMLALLGLTPPLAELDVAEALYLDAETTGLGGAGSVAFLVGMARYDAARQAFEMEQLWLEDLGRESPLLEQVRRRLERAQFVVTYNGKSFDLPLLQARCTMNGLPLLPVRPHLDLLHLVRRVHRHRSWPKSLTSVERHVLQLHRGPDVAGADVAERYHHYLRTGDGSGLDAVFHHNLDDVRSMIALLGLYGEPLERLDAGEMANAARVAKRVGKLDEAERLAAHAVARGGGALALRARADIAKARGDKWQALGDFQQLAGELDDPEIRLELAKLYEHFLRSPAAALRVVDEGTSETAMAAEHRRQRLLRKLRRG